MSSRGLFHADHFNFLSIFAPDLYSFRVLLFLLFLIKMSNKNKKNLPCIYLDFICFEYIKLILSLKNTQKGIFCPFRNLKNLVTSYKCYYMLTDEEKTPQISAAQ